MATENFLNEEIFLNILLDMGAESLNPESFVELEKIIDELKTNRAYFNVG